MWPDFLRWRHLESEEEVPGSEGERKFLAVCSLEGQEEADLSERDIEKEEKKEAAYTESTYALILSDAVEIGALLLMNGAEAGRVEDTMGRILRAYGFVRSDVFTITSSIVATGTLPGGRKLTETRRITKRDTNLGKIEKINLLSRKVCAHPLPHEELEEEIAKIRAQGQAKTVQTLFLYLLISASLTCFFKGNGEDAVASMLSGAVLFFSLHVTGRFRLNSILQLLLCSALTAASVEALVRLGIGSHTDLIKIGNIMLVIPGIQLTSSLRDMINDDIISGLLNLSEALLKAAFVALGFAMVALVGRIL